MARFGRYRFPLTFALVSLFLTTLFGQEDTRQTPGGDSRTKLAQRLRTLSPSAPPVRVIIFFKDQPAPELYRQFQEQVRVRRQQAESRFRSLAREPLLTEQALGVARQELNAIELDTRQRAMAEAEPRIRPLQDAVSAAIVGMGGRVILRTISLNAIAAEIPAAALATLASDPLIASIARDEVHKVQLKDSVPAIGAPTWWANGFQGDGEEIGIMDTGIRLNHPGVNWYGTYGPFLTDPPTEENCQNDNGDQDDHQGHGTHVAGIAAGSGASGWIDYRGVAPRARPDSYKIAACDGSANESNYMKALDYAVRNTSTRNFNLSFGPTTTPSSPIAEDNASASILDYYIDSYDFAISIAAGNGADCPVSNDSWNGLVVANWDRVSNQPHNSCYGPTPGGRRKPDLAAPGTNIVAPAYNWDGFSTDVLINALYPDYVSKSGTSMAAPHVAGATALLRSQGLRSSRQIRALLINTANGGVNWDSHLGWGVIDLTSAWQQKANIAESTIQKNGVVQYIGSSPGLMNITLVWNRHCVTSTCDKEEFNNLDLHVYRGDNGALLTESTSSVDNVERVQFNYAGQVIVRVTAANNGFSRLSDEIFALAFSAAGFSTYSTPVLQPSCAPAPDLLNASQSFVLSCSVGNFSFDASPPVLLSTVAPAGFGGGGSVNLGTIAPRATATFDFPMTAGASAGRYTIPATTRYTPAGGIPVEYTTTSEVRTRGGVVNVIATPPTVAQSYQYKIDNVLYQGTTRFNWAPSSTHSAEAVQDFVSLGGGSSRHVFQSWLGYSTFPDFQKAISINSGAELYELTAQYYLYHLIALAQPATGTIQIALNGAPTVPINPAVTGFYPAGTPVKVTAVPALGNRFKRWIGLTCPSAGGASDCRANPMSFTVDGPRNVSAEFVQNLVGNVNDSGAGSLRAAIQNAQSGDLIYLPSGTITLTQEIVIDKSLTLAGQGAANLSISGNDASRIFFVKSGSLVLSGVSLVHGRAKGGNGSQGGGGGAAGMGGAIFINTGASVTLSNVILASNQAAGGGGGAAANPLGGFGGGGGIGGDAIGGLSGNGGAFGTPGVAFGQDGGEGAGGGYGTIGPFGGLVPGNGGFGGGGGGGLVDIGFGGLGGFGGGGGGNYIGNSPSRHAGGAYGGAGGLQWDQNPANDPTTGGGGGGAALGGAIFVRAGGVFNVANSTFNNNLVQSGTGSGTGLNGEAKGGAVFNAGTSNVGANVTFTGNQASGAGSGTPCMGTNPLDTADICGSSSFPAPRLIISMSHAGNFRQGQTGATYTLKVTNVGASSAGTVNVTETLPAGLTLAGMSGSGWTCPQAALTCSRVDRILSGASYPDITVQVNVSGGASSPLVNKADVSGGGSVPASAFDSTVVLTTTVTNLKDAGPGSLRDVIQNVLDGTSLTLPGGTIDVTHEIVIDKNITLTGPGAASLTLDAHNSSRIFFVKSGTVTISGVSLINGLAKGGNGSQGGGGGAAGMGGAIFVNTGASAILSNVSLGGNRAIGGRGGVAANPLAAIGGGGGIGGDAIGSLSGNGGGFGTPGATFGQDGGDGAGGGYGTIGPFGGLVPGNGGFGGGGGGGLVDIGPGGLGGFGGGGGGNYLGNTPSRHAGGAYGGAGGLQWDQNPVHDPTTGGGGGGAALGGAIFIRAGGTLTLSSTDFLNSQVIGGTGAGTGLNGEAKGGAVFNAGTFKLGANVTFAGSQAPGAGTGTACTGPNPADTVNICGAVVLLPDLHLSKAHLGSFAQGQSGAVYTLVVSNPSGAGVSSGTVTVTETVPAGMSLVSMAGQGWLCSPGQNTCTRSDSLAPGSSYPLITVTVNIAANAASPLTNRASLSLAGSAGASTADSTTILPALRFIAVPPCRIADTRKTNLGLFGAPSIAGNTSRDFVITNSACSIPATAQAYSVNVAVVPSGPLGFLTLYPAGQARPVASTLNAVDGRVKSNAAIVPAGTGGAVSVYASNTTDVVLDIDGYFVPAADINALAFYPVTPCRIADTRKPAAALAGPALVGQQSRTFPILSGTCNLPASARAYSLNFAAVPGGPLGFVTAYPTGQAMPVASSLNATTGTVTANAVIVPAGTNGAIDVFASNPTNLVIDVNGYFAPPGPGGLSLYAVTPCRVLDSRKPAGSPAITTTDVAVSASACGIPATAQAFVFSVTAVPPTALGFLTLWPQGQTQPVVSTLNAVDGAITSNMAIVPTTNGSITAFGSNPTHLVLDIVGYFGQ